MPLKSLAGSDEGPVPEDSTTRLSKWTDPDFFPPWLTKKPREVQELHEPVARSMAFATKMTDEALRPARDCATFRLLYEKTKDFVAIAGPRVAAMTEALESVRIRHRCPEIVDFLGLHDNYHAAGLAHAKYMIALVDAEQLAEAQRVAAERHAGAVPAEPRCERIIEGFAAKLKELNVPDPHRILVFAKKEALRWDMPGPPAAPSGAVGRGAKRWQGAPPLPPARHSHDFTSVHWWGADYTFNHMQSMVVSELWHAWERGTNALHYRTILTEIKSDSERLEYLFRDPKSSNGYHPAWGTMIVRVEGKKGLYRLQVPEN